MAFIDLATDRWSVRKFSDKPVEQEKIDKILEAGKVAPTAKNYQPQKIYVVRSPELLAGLAELTPCTYGAPMVVVMAYDEDLAWHNERRPGYNSGEMDSAIVLTHMMLAAWELGVGSCWVGMFNDSEVERLLDLPDNIHVTALMPMGYAREDAHPARSLHPVYRPLDEMVEYR